MVKGEEDIKEEEEEEMLATPQPPLSHPLNLKSEESGDEDSCSSSAASSCADSISAEQQNKFNGLNLSNMPGLISPPIINQNMVNAPLNLSLNSNSVSGSFQSNGNSGSQISPSSAGSHQPNNMPHLILASGQMIQGIQGAQLLIPTTDGITTQTILTIPVNHVTSNQPVNLALNNGQVISTTIANLQSMAQQPNPLLNNGRVSPNDQHSQPPPQQNQHQQPSSLSSSAQKLLASALTSINLASMNNQQQKSSSMTSHRHSLTPHHQRSSSYHTNNNHHHYQNNMRKSPLEPNNNHHNIPHNLISNKPTSPIMKTNAAIINNNNNNLTSNNNNTNNVNNNNNTTNNRRSVSPVPPSLLPSAHSPLSRISTNNGELTITTTNNNSNSNNKYEYAASAASGGSDQQDIPDDLSDETNEPMISQSNSNMVDGINLDEIKEFAKAFKLRRLSLGLTQTQVGQALSVTEGPAYSQSAICSALATQMLCAAQIASQQQQQNMFEKLDITPKSAQKIKPVLERWMKEAEERYKSGQNHLTEFIGMEPSKKRKRRTSFTPQALELLNAHFERNTHPSGTEITTLAHQLGYEREVIRIWFCNKRQALKNTVRMMSKGSL